VPPGLSIPTSLAAALRAPAWPAWLRAPAWLEWLAGTADGPLLVLLGLVLLACGLGLWTRRSSREPPP